MHLLLVCEELDWGSPTRSFLWCLGDLDFIHWRMCQQVTGCRKCFKSGSFNWMKQVKRWLDVLPWRLPQVQTHSTTLSFVPLYPNPVHSVETQLFFTLKLFHIRQSKRQQPLPASLLAKLRLRLFLLKTKKKKKMCRFRQSCSLYPMNCLQRVCDCSSLKDVLHFRAERLAVLPAFSTGAPLKCRSIASSSLRLLVFPPLQPHPQSISSNCQPA